MFDLSHKSIVESNLVNQKILGKSVRPLAGFAFVKLEGNYDETVGLIHIPGISRARKVGYGEIIAWNPTKEQIRAYGGIDVPVGWFALCQDYSKTPIDIDSSIYRIPIEAVLCVCDERQKITGDIKPFNGVERCQWCGPAKDGSPNSMILDYTGFCPRCGKNALGEKKDQFSEESLKPFMR